MKDKLRAVIYSMPFQLLLNHLKRNVMLLVVWAIIIAAFTGHLGKVYGIHYLFLDPEYMGEISFWSFFLIGTSLGTFIMGWHITCYILDSHRFRFVGILERPFSKFVLNNSPIPVFIVVLYLYHVTIFQWNNLEQDKALILSYLLGFLSGLATIKVLFIFYFRLTNKDIFKYLAGAVDKKLRKNPLSRNRLMKRVVENRADKYRVKSYLDLNLKVRSTSRIINFYNKEAILRVFDQNHFNSVLLELIIIILVLSLGFFADIPAFQIPAAASAILILTTIVMLAGAVIFWFKSWSNVFVISIFLLLNASTQFKPYERVSQAQGLSYDSIKPHYTISSIQESHTAEKRKKDKKAIYEILENWKEKQTKDSPRKMVFVCVSGGGQRAAMWAVNSLLACDSALSNQLMEKTFMISGASGGLIGAAYFRDFWYRRDKNDSSCDDEIAIHRMGKDNLNPVIFGLLVNDLFTNFQTHSFKGKSYKSDRGYQFEKNLSLNLRGPFRETIGEYAELEESAEIPLLLMSPTIANDGRKLYISPHHLSFLATSGENQQTIEAVDFQTIFEKFNGENLSFLSALRMSASFPYITPNISLPTLPRTEIMDAGISDNFGIVDATKMIFAFREWITENTDGVVLLVIRDSKPDAPTKPLKKPSIVDRMTYPVASVYNNLTKMQDINNASRLAKMTTWLDSKVEMIEISYDPYFNTNGQLTEMERASLSWHLTTKEKRSIQENISIQPNIKGIAKLRNLLETKKDSLVQ